MQVSSLGAEIFAREYHNLGRPVLVRGAMSLAQRCAYSRTAPAVQSLAEEKQR